MPSLVLVHAVVESSSLGLQLEDVLALLSLVLRHTRGAAGDGWLTGLAGVLDAPGWPGDSRLPVNAADC